MYPDSKRTTIKKYLRQGEISLQAGYSMMLRNFFFFKGVMMVLQLNKMPLSKKNLNARCLMSKICFKYPSN